MAVDKDAPKGATVWQCEVNPKHTMIGKAGFCLDCTQYTGIKVKLEAKP